MFAARTNLTQWGVIRAIVVQDSLYLLRGLTRRDGGRRLDPLEPRAGGESSVILLHPPLPSVGVSTVMERGGVSENDSLADCGSSQTLCCSPFSRRINSCGEGVPVKMAVSSTATRREFCHSADISSLSPLVHLPIRERGAAEWQSRRWRLEPYALPNPGGRAVRDAARAEEVLVELLACRRRRELELCHYSAAPPSLPLLKHLLSCLPGAAAGGSSVTILLHTQLHHLC